ncbi:MAG: hypothetical protein KR126chlam3_00093 [Chlamydiae bacterium]|nr:hypothetical protein [Chlamydiota bacterium]
MRKLIMRPLHNSFRQLRICLFRLNRPFMLHKFIESLLHIPRTINPKNSKFFRRKQLCNSLILFFLICFPPLVAGEGEAYNEKYIVLPEEKVHEGDYFAAGKTIEISGVVNGDVYAVGSQIIIDGHVLGSVIASGLSIEISGIVNENVRLAGGQIEINGTIGRNVTAAAGNIQFATRSSVGGNVVITGGIVDLYGNIKGDLSFSSSNARLLGDVGKNVKANVGKFRIGSKANIAGNLNYSSPEEARISPGAEINGNVLYKPSQVSKFFKGKWQKRIFLGSRMVGILMNFVFSFVLGTVFLKVFPRKLKKTLDKLQNAPWKSLWTGLLVLILLPIVCLILFITILGFPIGLALLAISVLGFYTAKIFPIIWSMNALLPKIHMKQNSLVGLAIGLILFFLFVQVPFLGALLMAVFTLLGLGAVVLSRVPRRKVITRKSKKSH